MLHNFARLVVKYGGNAMGGAAEDALFCELAALRAAGHAVILVHGGGPEIDEALRRRGLSSRRVDGLRVTDQDALDVVEAVLCATANKRLVRSCLQQGISAVGISGQDGGLIRARRARSPSGGDLGFVGEIVSVDPAPLLALLQSGYLPVVSPIAVDERAEHAYNVNADTVAGAIAAAIKADAYVALTNVDRVLRDPADPGTAIEELSLPDALHFASSEACATGMRPKLLAAIDAIAGGASRAYICGTKPGAIAGALAGDATVIA
ncbi:MAG TPA: acetylglutamate kinase [Candidatus Baltobacteraceae bacterium]|nr:acetylglutamate kinase [Candidatus Baltobacteraceae bacterium]